MGVAMVFLYWLKTRSMPTLPAFYQDKCSRMTGTSMESKVDGDELRYFKLNKFYNLESRRECGDWTTCLNSFKMIV